MFYIGILMPTSEKLNDQQLFYTLYELIPLEDSKIMNRALKRQGALLKVVFSDGKMGYADCHPWTERGDATLLDQLKMLKNGEMTSLTAQSLRMARYDASARERQISLFEKLCIPRSHYLIPNILNMNATKWKACLSQSYQTFKIKLGLSLKEEIQALYQAVTHGITKRSLRLDFNDVLTPSNFKEFLEKCEPILEYIDFIEDPFVFDPQAWKHFQDVFQISLAADKQVLKALKYPEAVNTLIIKPAIFPFDSLHSFAQFSSFRVIVTSYLDHPVGQLGAAFWAASNDIKDECGLVSHQVYHENAFSQLLKVEQGRLIPPKGICLGFDELLDVQEWKNI